MLVLVRDLRYAPAMVWEALTDPAQLCEWAPFDADRNLGTEGVTVRLTWAGTSNISEARVTRAEAPKLLEFHDIRWELEPRGSGTRLTLWHAIDRRYIAMGAAGWHICLDVLDRLVAGRPLGRIVGGEAMKFGWPRLNKEYAAQFGVEPMSPPGASQ